MRHHKRDDERDDAFKRETEVRAGGLSNKDIVASSVPCKA
jgi:hypothetical protein